MTKAVHACRRDRHSKKLLLDTHIVVAVDKECTLIRDRELYSLTEQSIRNRSFVHYR
jgi:hypothetical protein